jgi:protoporphyrinogen oxidase
MARDGNGIIVLGGGLAGLACGYFAEASVYEASDHHGGAAASDKVDGFVFDRGIHVLQTKNQKVLDLLDELGVRFAIRRRSAHIYAFKRFTPYPFQINSTNLPLGKRLRCVLDFLRRKENPEPADYQGWMYRNIGRGFADTFLIPYSEKFWGVHPREMTFEWTGNRVPEAKALQVLRGAVIGVNTKVGTNASFRYPEGAGGYGAVADSLRDKVAELHLGHEAVSVDVAQKTVTFANGRQVPFEVLVSTIPLPVLVDICSEVPQEVREAVASLRTNKIMVVNLGIKRADISSKHWVHFPEKEISFFRISFPHNFSPETVPPGMSSVSAEVSVPEEPADREALIQRVIADLQKVGILREDDEVVASLAHYVRWGYCIYDEARQQAIPVIKKWLRSVDIVPCGRYGLWTYFWSDEAILSGRKGAEQAKSHLETIKATAAA